MALTKDEIEREIERLARWHYQIDVGGVTTPIYDKQLINRQGGK